LSTDQTPADNAFSKLLEQFQEAVVTGRFSEADQTLQNVLEGVEDWCDEDQSPSLALTNVGSECEARGDWRGAELAYRQVLTLTDLEPMSKFQAHRNLAGLYRLLDRHNEALVECRQAVIAARESDTTVLLAVALETLARDLQKAGLVDEAQVQLAEALEVIGEDQMCCHIIGSILTEQGRCAIAKRQLPTANEKLSQAYKLLEPQSAMTFAAGVQQDMAHWWVATAELRSAQNQSYEAVAAWEQAVSFSRHVAALPHAQSINCDKAVSEMLRGLARALAVVGRRDESFAAFAEEKTLLEAIGLVGD
jgi:tetratricopeptide (TPR) repeat protein